MSLKENMVLKIMFWNSFSPHFENLKFFNFLATTTYPKIFKIHSKEWNNKDRVVFNPLTPMSDQDRISPYKINTISTR